ncbi:hypothetical protein MMC28_009785 [Mycoblastus sanguinarius]|nr:hypothetical protein [Mycoblastus sanguinarius]
MDPDTNTREQFTAHITSTPNPPSAAPAWSKLVDNLKILLDKLAHHSAMAPNLQQIYMTPAASKNKVYFMWDFVGRTLGSLYNVNPTLQKLSKQEKEAWEEAKGRATYAKMLMTDAMPGMLDQMTASTYPGQSGQHPALGEDILEVARRLD